MTTQTINDGLKTIMTIQNGQTFVIEELSKVTGTVVVCTPVSPTSVTRWKTLMSCNKKRLAGMTVLQIVNIALTKPFLD